MAKPVSGRMPSTPVQIARDLSKAVQRLAFGSPITHVYHPLDYAWESHQRYLQRFAGGPREVLLIGMNPGPWGMAQTGIPFGDVRMVKNWLGITGRVTKPPNEHPMRPILGFACPHSEISGTRLWGWARDVFHTPERFFARFFVYNYCPLCFMTSTGRNFTPDRLPLSEAVPLYAGCDEALRRLAEYMKPRYVLGVGGFAEKRIQAALPAYDGVIGRMPHPSPANPAANRGWAQEAERALNGFGIRW